MCPFIFLTFLFFTPHVRHFMHVFRFRSFPGEDFFLFLRDFHDNLRFFKVFLISIWCRSVIMLCLSNSRLHDIPCCNNHAHAEVFLFFIGKKKLEYLLKTKVSNRLHMVLGVLSPRTMCPLFFDILFFTPHVRHFKLRLTFQVQVFPRRIVLFWGEIAD